MKIIEGISNNEKEIAIDSLQKLIEKQTRELEQTRDLLRLLENANESADSENSIAILQNNTWVSDAQNLTTSFLCGVDYGFLSRSEGSKFNFNNMVVNKDNDTKNKYGPPVNVARMALSSFVRNFFAIMNMYPLEIQARKIQPLTQPQVNLQEKLKTLTLNVAKVWEKEETQGHYQNAALIVKIPYLILCYFLDYVFDGKYVFARFYFLETVARMPYFSYISMLHLYETLGWWRRSADAKRVHFAEEWNEFHHLLIMESLGGDSDWWVRALAMHSAVAYYWALVALWLISPSLGYQFSELLETHAVNTYTQLLDENEEALKSLPPTVTAVRYYSLSAADPFFDEMQTYAAQHGLQPRRPGFQMTNLYQVFCAIRDDEGDHVQTMVSCIDPDVALKSPSVEKALLAGLASISTTVYLFDSGVVDVDPNLMEQIFAYDVNIAEQVGAVGSILNAEFLERALSIIARFFEFL